MDMKLDGSRIKQLRVQRSWSQEKLAEAARLNSRTVQRVEADGKASLQTRLQLANALQVHPSELDAAEHAPTPETGSPRRPKHLALLERARSGSHFPLLLLISLIFLAWSPLYFILSKTNFAWNDYRQFLSVSSLWLLLIVGAWIVLALPWLAYAHVKKKEVFGLLLAYLFTPLLLGVTRVWQPDAVWLLCTWSLYLSSLFLLASFYLPALQHRLARHMVGVSLGSYVFIWMFHGPLYSFAFAALYRWRNGMEVPLPWLDFSDYLLRLATDITQLLPVALVLLFSLGIEGGRGGDNPPAFPKMAPSS